MLLVGVNTVCTLALCMQDHIWAMGLSNPLPESPQGKAQSYGGEMGIMYNTQIIYFADLANFIECWH